MLGHRGLRQADSLHDVAANAARCSKQQPKDAKTRGMRERLGQFGDLDVHNAHKQSCFVHRRYTITLVRTMLFAEEQASWSNGRDDLS